VFAFALPNVLGKWGGRIREIAMDSTCKSMLFHDRLSCSTDYLGNTTRANYELYSVLGECYGSGLPLAYLLVRSPGSTKGGEIQSILEQYLGHLAQKYNLQIATTLTDKNWPEINACRAKFPASDHQLCFWHVLQSIKKRLSILPRQPAFYNVTQARSEFPWIDKDFLPIAQRTDGKVTFIFAGLCCF
jgi:hypothetical protein